MACEDVNKRRCFTYIWKVENADHWWKLGTDMQSPAFTVDEINETNWKLQLYFSFTDRYSNSCLYLRRQADDKGAEKVEIDCEITCLSFDGTVLYSFNAKNSVIGKGDQIASGKFPSRNEVFYARRSVFLSKDTLTVRCKMWKSVGEISKEVQWFARTRIAVEKKSFLWDITDFSALGLYDKRTYIIKSLSNGEQLMSLELSLTSRSTLEDNEKILRLKITPIYRNIKMSTLQLSIVDASKNTVICLLCELCTHNGFGSKEFTLFHTRIELMEKRSAYLPNDVLSLLCECSFCFGTLVEEIEGASSNCPAIEKKEQDAFCLDKANVLPVSKNILIDDFKSLLNDSLLSDVKLKTRSKTYPAHKCILSVRSPVFKAMFSSDMKEKINDCVDIEDLSDGTVLQMLRYLYSADVEELEWSRATELYEAADKYQILNLKDICSSYLKSNLCPNNACEALVLADLHQEEDLKSFVQNFILRHGKDIINSEDWKQLMETNLKLAAETMCLKFKE